MAYYYDFGGFRVLKPGKEKKNKEKPLKLNPYRTLSAPIWRICSGCNKFTPVKYQNRFQPTTFYCVRCMSSK